jgi:Na+-translocating ferredoxin:NAD+ oxidoreductase subunit C
VKFSRPRKGVAFPLVQDLPATLWLEENRLVIPLRNYRYDQSESAVQAGDHVVAGQPLSRPLGFLARPVLSPVDADVVDVQRVQVPVLDPQGVLEGGRRTLLCVILERRVQAPQRKATLAWREKSTEQLFALLEPYGLHDADGLPLDFSLRQLPQDAQLVFTLAALQPGELSTQYYLQKERSLLEQAFEALLRLASFKTVTLVISSDQKDQASRLAALFDHHLPTRVHVIQEGYPWDHPRLVALALDRTHSPEHQSFASEGVLMLGLRSLCRLGQRLTLGQESKQALVVQTYSESASGMRPEGEAKLMMTWPGHSIQSICEAAGLEPNAQLLLGTPLRGHVVLNRDWPLPDGVEIMSVYPEGAFAPEREDACISCGLCLDICPMHLSPPRLVHLVQDDRLFEAKTAGLSDCLDCGLCTWHCPSRINLGHGLRKGLYRLQEARHAF